MLTRTLDITAADFLDGTGWDIKPQGACKAEVCVPLASAESGFDLTATAERLGMAIVTDEAERPDRNRPRIDRRPSAGYRAGPRVGAERSRRQRVQAVVAARPEGRDRFLGAILRLLI